MSVLNETYNRGLLEAYVGPMFSGKSLRLIQRLDRLDYSDVSYILFKPEADIRNKDIWSRSMNKSYSCFIIDQNNPDDIFDYISDEDVVAIDEIQFFDSKLWNSIDSLLKNDVNVVVAGLDTDFRGEPFGVTPLLLSHADIVYKLHAFCDFSVNNVKCKAPARLTQRLENGLPADYNSPVVLLGDVDEGYEVRCRKHHVVRNKPS